MLPKRGASLKTRKERLSEWQAYLQALTVVGAYGDAIT
jgi:hypothetical protein